MKKSFTRKSGYPIFLVLLFTVNLFLPLSYAKDDYVVTAGVIWATNFATNNLVKLQAGHNYYYVFETTENLQISGLVFNLWNVSSVNATYDYIYQNSASPFNDIGVYHLDITFYEASASQSISVNNPLTQFYKGKLTMFNDTDTVQYFYSEANGQTYVATHSNVFIALSISPSIDIYINSTTATNFIQYEQNIRQDLITKLEPSLQNRLGVLAYWSLRKGAVSEDINHPIPTIYNDPSTLLNNFSLLTGFSFDAVGIAVYTASLIGLSILCYQRGIDLSPQIIGVLAITLSILYTILGIIPIWFLLGEAILSITLISYGYTGKESSNDL